MHARISMKIIDDILPSIKGIQIISIKKIHTIPKNVFDVKKLFSSIFLYKKTSLVAGCTDSVVGTLNFP